MLVTLGTPIRFSLNLLELTGRPVNTVKAVRRSSFIDNIERQFRDRPVASIPVTDSIKADGLCRWRSRIAAVRPRFRDAGRGRVEWHRDVHASKYRRVPNDSLGRNARWQVSQGSLFWR